MKERECDNRYVLIQDILEQLPPVPGAVGVRRELLSQARMAVAQHDTKQLEKLYREVQMLARSLGIQSGGRINCPPPGGEPDPNCIESTHPETANVCRDAGPGLPDWDRRQRRRSRVREHAPIRYPYGDEPPVRPRSSSDTLPGKPESLLPAACRERLAAYRRWFAGQEDDCRFGGDALGARLRPASEPRE